MTTDRQARAIVVGVDGSEQSRRALHWAVRQAELTGDTVRAVIAWEPPFTGWGADVPASGEKAMDDIASRVLAESVTKVAGAEPTVGISTRVARGTPAQVLLSEAGEQDVVLLVVGSRGIGGFAGALLGSVGQHCAQHAPCPVLIVRGD
ncbi:universal stress protein [Kitasatospora sp. DSM 101779]|uniref:universal stress protein n=1 Tax=Kitasatospora sp. DSM 101779 TaxID=2853165 RepID=UPI0021DB2F32|nr:universal stress protein [Kitasatospora sp. DSM 101779]MCU7826488.1 universal stress protein [Kitasatospora sp. DSM 101779]